jgi:3',5'-cyclic-AMP phosphodiesterase
MRILSVDIRGAPLDVIPYVSAIRGGGSELAALPVLRATVDELPADVAAIVVASDLQGVELTRQPGVVPRLLGEVLAARLGDLAARGRLPPLDQIGVILAGDLYAAISRRGGLGDVRAVWRAFAERFRWVVGVAGNHDHFGSPSDQAQFAGEPRVGLLDASVVTLDGLHIGGVSGIVGDPRRPFRRSEDELVRASATSTSSPARQPGRASRHRRSTWPAGGVWPPVLA